jgi:hypothetical protein
MKRTATGYLFAAQEIKEKPVRLSLSYRIKTISYQRLLQIHNALTTNGVVITCYLAYSDTEGETNVYKRRR